MTLFGRDAGARWRTMVMVAMLGGFGGRAEGSQLSALSVRGPAGTGDATMIVGVAYAGGEGKSTLVRGVGPGLAGDVSGYLADPQLRVYDATDGNAEVASNDDWAPGLASEFTRLGMGTLTVGSKDAALQATLPHGLYTVHVTGKSGATGVALAEVYDAATGDLTKRLSALSVRNQVGTGASVLIAGFVVSGTESKRVVIAGKGPALSGSVSGYLTDPQLQVHRMESSGSVLVAENDNWGGTSELTEAFAEVGLSEPGNADAKDAALVLTLGPGVYTATLSGVGGTTGVGLIEIYEMMGTLALSYPSRATVVLEPMIKIEPAVANITSDLPTRYTVTQGTLPAGLQLNSDGSISGTPITLGSATITVEVANAERKAAATFSVSVLGSHHAMENHWLANTGGRPGLPSDWSLPSLLAWNGNVGNFLTDIGIIVDEQLGGIPTVQVLTQYDETGMGNYLNDPERPTKQLGAVYYNGQRISKGFSTPATRAVDSTKSTSSKTGVTASIKNFYGRFFNFDSIRNDPPPTGANAPYVALSDGRSITVVEDPTAVDFDLSGRLWIADNGPDQNIKIFDLEVSLTTPAATFGEKGGVFAGPTRGATGDFRFWGPRGIAHDAAGHIYIGCTGLTMMIIGGTDLRMFSADGQQMLWQAYGTFLDTASADPASQGASLYLCGKRYEMDYTQPPGKSSKWAGVTFDPFTYGDDPRVNNAYAMLGIRRINGQRFMFCGTMYGSVVAVYRFEEGSEIAVPCAYLCLGGEKGLSPDYLTPLHPTWDDNEINKRNRWAWRDSDGDGHFSSTSEFVIWENWTPYSQGIDIDDAGGIWFGGSGLLSPYFRGGGVQYWPCTGVDAQGVPIYDFANPQRFDVPYGDGQTNSGVNRLKYLSQTDTMFFAGGNSSWYPKAIYCYKNFTDAARRTLAFSIDLGFFDNLDASGIHLDLGTAPMVLPFSFTADQDYIYVVYLDNGKDGRKRGEVTIYSAVDGHQVDFIVPGEVVGGGAGAVDIVNGVHVTTDADGWKIIMVEDDGGAKVMAYRWKP